jgi:hypothetical protein
VLTGLIHGHSGLAYLLVLSASAHFCVAAANAVLGSRPGLVRVGVVLGRRVEPALMGVIGLLGLGAWAMSGLPITLPYLWAGVLAVVAQGALVGMGTKPALVALAAGDSSASWRWTAVATANLLLIVGIFGAMQVW